MYIVYESVCNKALYTMSCAMRDKYLFAFLDISATNLPRDRVNAAPSSQDKDESGFASIDELDPKSAKATWANDLIVGREDCGVGNPRFEFPFEAVDGDNPGKSFGASWGGIPHQTRERFLC